MSEGAEFLAERDVSRETFERLNGYAALLQKWNAAINLVSSSTIEDLWRRHMLDSAQVFDLRPKGTASWADFGSGGGFPGMVIAILAMDEAPEVSVTLVESDVRKATFLNTVARELKVPVRVIPERIEKIAPLGVDVVSARALASLTQLLGFAERHLSVHGRALLLKGASYEAELEEALEAWRFDVQKSASKTDPRAVVLNIGEISRA